MSNLDDKLREIAPNVDAGQWQRIHQAFADERYVKVSKGNQGKIKTAQIFSIEHGTYELMTGQEFYDRFWEIYNEDRNPQIADSTIVREQVDKIAKRAAGIET